MVVSPLLAQECRGDFARSVLVPLAPECHMLVPLPPQKCGYLLLQALCFLSYLAGLEVLSLEPALPPWRDEWGQGKAKTRRMGKKWDIFGIFFEAKGLIINKNRGNKKIGGTRGHLY